MMTVLCVCAGVLVLLLTQSAVGLDFYSYGPAYDAQLPKQNDVSSEEIPLSVPIIFFGETYSSIFVNCNGLLSFLTEIPKFFSIQFPLNYPIIAPLYANVDTTGTGQVYYRETTDPVLLQRASDKIRRFYPRLENAFSATSLFIATWVEVGYFPRGVDKVNTFQAVVASDGAESFVELLYRQGGLQWVQGEGYTSGLPDARAQAGFVSEDGRLYTLRGSGTDQIQNLDRWSNSDEPGAWLFRVGNTGATGNVEPPQVPNGDNENLIEDTSCQKGATFCHSRADCVDTEDSFCCVCQKGYYGNGRTCLQDQIPLRVNGKISISLNDEPAQDIDVQAYIVTADGRSYTAFSQVPSSVGTDAQLVTSTADIIGWLFAKSINSAPNGYQLTGGVLNHTAVLTFANSQHRTTVEQRFIGLDVFDQIRMEGNVSGTVPQVPYGYKLIIPDSQTLFHKTSPGKIQAQSTYTVTVENSPEQFPVTVEQTILYTEYCPTSAQEGAFRVKAARNFISYEQTENILRFAATNKISSLSENEDPCVEGKVNCVNNSYCIPEGTSFRCACNKGFQTLYSEENSGDYGCIDINECQSGSHTCDENALCINEVGTYSCQCRQGYSGNGYYCQTIIQDCSSISCNPGAECVESAENGPRCYCIPGFIGDGTTCTPNAEDDCLICSPHAWCNRTQSGSVECFCLPGYHGDGRECTQEEDTTTQICMFDSCWCPSGYVAKGEICMRDHGSNAPITTLAPVDEFNQPSDDDLCQHPMPECYSSSQCICPKGYVLKGDFCIPEPGANHHTHFSKGPSGDALSCNSANNCHPQAQCIYLSSEGTYKCQCNAGYEGDGFDCSEIELSCREADICHLFATCVDEEGTDRAICVCYDGYQGDGTNCYKTDICSQDIECGDHATCVWSEDSQRKECECDPGYVLDYKICIKQGCDECHEDAECLVNPATGLPQCVCKSGFVGDGEEECVAQTIGCNVLNNCAVDADCVYVSPDAGYRCDCKQGFEGNGVECRRVNTCLNDPSLCSSNARCLPSGTGYECQCVSGYVGNGVTCTEITKVEGGFLLVNKGMATVKIPQERSKTNPGRPIQLQYDQIAIGLDVDCVEGLVYWSDITNQVIKRSNLNGKDLTIFIDKDVSSPEGLAVDWMSRKLYWTDSGKDVIKSANLETGDTETIISSGLVNPRGIAVHPTRRKVYWSDWNRAEPKLESANLDGSGRDVLVSHNVELPNSLAIDWNTQELCWTDAGTKKIECLSLDTGVRRTVVSNCSYPFGLAITADKYYWTDWQTQKVESTFKYSSTPSESLTVSLGGAGKLFGITAISESCPRL